jgi:hypothetical protein
LVLESLVNRDSIGVESLQEQNLVRAVVLRRNQIIVDILVVLENVPKVLELSFASFVKVGKVIAAHFLDDIVGVIWSVESLLLEL